MSHYQHDMMHCSQDKCKKKDQCYRAIKVIFPNETDGGLLVLDDQSFDRHFEMVFSETIFLHEFQHVLRLCGIGKEIVL